MRRMKDSGIEWIGEIPEEWAVRRLRYLTTLRLEKGYMGSEDTYIGLENIESGTGRLIETETRYDEGIYDRFYAGDLMFSKLRPYLAKIVILNFDGFCTSELLVFKDTSVYKNFLYYVFLSDGFISTVDRSTYGTKMPRASWEFIKNIAIPVPLNTQQKMIADYLDRKCAEIDAVIARQEAVIEKLKEYKLSLITEAVTKGLNPDAPMKGSGVEWIGQIPEHWSVLKANRVSKRLTVGVVVKPADYFDEEGTVPFLRGINVKEYSIYSEPMVYINEDTNRILSKTIVHTGDILIVRDGSIGTACVVPEKYDGANVVSMIIMSVVESCSAGYICYCLNSRIGKLQFDLTKIGSALTHTSVSSVSNLQLTIPPKEEQDDITKYLDQKCRTIDEAVKNKQALIDHLTSYKKSLIYEVVTGKREIPA